MNLETKKSVINKSQKEFFEFFPSVSWGLCDGIKGEKIVLFGFCTGTKSEIRTFEIYNYQLQKFL